MIRNTSNDSVIQLPDASHELRALRRFANSSLFAQPRSFFSSSPFVRPSRPQDVTPDLLQPRLVKEDLTHSTHLLAQRLLLSSYEQDLMFLPHDARNFEMEEFRTFYAPEFTTDGRISRKILERYAFDWLRNMIDVSGKWTLESFIGYTDKILQGIATSDSHLSRVLTHSADPEHAAKFFVIQCAGDFLSEASAMGRNVLGNFGRHLSELFKLYIDEYGYGVYEKKHSALFESLMTQLGLSNDIHHYWQFYTPFSLALINYFHYVSANHSMFFRYLGALYYTEASLAYIAKQQSKAIKNIFGDKVSTQYFDEHGHIDQHHGRMALKKLIEPLVLQYGDWLVPEILRGFEEFRLLQDFADQELFNHIQWHDNLEDLRRKAALLLKTERKADLMFKEVRGEVSVTHLHPVDELLWVQEGMLKVVVSPEKFVRLNAGEGVVIPKGLLHGSLVETDSCSYSVVSLESERKQ